MIEGNEYEFYKQHKVCHRERTLSWTETGFTSYDLFKSLTSQAYENCFGKLLREISCIIVYFKF